MLCRLEKSALLDVSDPVRNTPSQPRTGAKNGNQCPVDASANASVDDRPEKFAMKAKPSTQEIVKMGLARSTSVSLNTVSPSRTEMLSTTIDSNAEIRIPDPVAERRSRL